MDARAARRRAPRMAERAAPHARSGGRHARSRLPRVARRVGVSRHPRRRLGGLRALRDALVLRRALARAGRVVARLVGTRLRAAAARRERRGGPPLHRQRGQRRPAARPRSARRLRCVGRGGGAAALPRRPAGRRHMTRLRDVTLHAVIVGAAAFVMALAFPRTDWSLTPWLALAPLLAIATMRTPRTAFLWGWASGTVFFLVLLRWLQYTFQVYSAIPWPLVYGPVFLLAAYCGFWTGAVAWAVSWLTARRSAALALGLAPFLWVAAEWLRGHLFGGFPWGALGYSQYLHLRVIQIAELAGVHAVSFVLLAVNAALAGCVVLRWRHALVGAGAAAALLAATLVFGTMRLAEPLPEQTVRVAIIQPSIEQPLKWEPRHTRETLGIYFALLQRVAEQHPDLIVWPETAAPTILRRDPPLIERFRTASAELGVPMLVGSIDAVGDPPRFRNSAFLITDQGIVGRYDKIQLVPFGEFVPLSRVLGFVRRWAEFISQLE